MEDLSDEINDGDVQVFYFFLFLFEVIMDNFI